MKKFLFVLLVVFLTASFAHAADVTLTWEKPNPTHAKLINYDVYRNDKF